MRKRLFWWSVAGFLWTSAAGTLLHFLYEWNGGAVTAVLGAVNESVWEHMKLLVIPAVLLTAVQIWTIGGMYPQLPAARAVSIPAGALAIPVLYYTLTGALGTLPTWVHISMFFLVTAGMFLLDHRLMCAALPKAGWVQFLAAAALWILAFFFVWCTFRPPEFPLWQDPVTGVYGLP